jgi:hypothetical protein
MGNFFIVLAYYVQGLGFFIFLAGIIVFVSFCDGAGSNAGN